MAVHLPTTVIPNVRECLDVFGGVDSSFRFIQTLAELFWGHVYCYRTSRDSIMLSLSVTVS